MSHDGNIELNEKELEQCKEEAVTEFKKELTDSFFASITIQLNSLIATVESISKQLEIQKEILEKADDMPKQVQQIYDKVG